MTPSRSRQPLDPDARGHPRGRRGRRRASYPLTLLLVGLGGAVGTTARSQLETAFPTAAGAWPWTTFWINVSGAFVLGVLLETLAVLGPDQGWRRGARLGVGTGVLGGYTTYSSFVVETAVLGRDSHYVLAAGYDIASLVLGFGVAYLGTIGVSRLHRRVHIGRLEAGR